MKFRAEIDVMPLDEILDPQGKVVNSNLPRLGITGVESVRIGRHISMVLEADNKEDAEGQVGIACKKLLSNPVMEKYSFEVVEV